MTKFCSSCKKYLEFNNFYKNCARQDNLSTYCKNCIKEKYQYTRDSRQYNLKSKYNLSIDEFNRLLQTQDNVCALCRSNSNKFCVDHCHLTGKIRGILCAKCNTGLGQFNDDQNLLHKAINYLNESSNR